MKHWIKAAAISGPLLILGTVYAFASSDSGNSSGVTFTVHPNQTSQSSVTQGQSGAAAQTMNQANASSETASNTNTSTGTTPNSTVQNPFLVASGQSSTTSGQTAVSSTNGTQENSSNPSFSIASIQHLLVQASSADGKIILNYMSDENGNSHLEGMIGNKPIHLDRDEATKYLEDIFGKWNLQVAMQSVLSSGSAQWNLPNGLHVDHLNMQLFNHQQINLNEYGAKAKVQQPEGVHPVNGKDHGNKHGKGVEHHQEQGDQGDGADH